MTGRKRVEEIAKYRLQGLPSSVSNSQLFRRGGVAMQTAICDKDSGTFRKDFLSQTSSVRLSIRDAVWSVQEFDPRL